MAQRRNRALLVIAVFKFCKGILLLILAVGLLRLLHRDVREVLEGWIESWRFDPGNRFAGAVLEKAGLLNDRRIEQLSGLTAIYAALFLTEGTGLALGKRWAEWLTLVATASFIPLEIYEVFHHCTIARVLLLLGNIAIVIYLARNLLRAR